MKKVILAVAILIGAVWSEGVAAAPTAAQLCQASKNKAAGVYAACRQKAEATLAVTGNTTKYDDAIEKCVAKYQAVWQAAEQKAIKAGSSCTTTNDEADVKGATDGYTDNVAQHLGRCQVE